MASFTTSKRPASLSTCPPEIVQLLFEALGFHGACYFRLVCRYFFAATALHFRRKFFATIDITDLSLQSLQTLVNISRRPDLRDHVCTLDILELPQNCRHTASGRGSPWRIDVHNFHTDLLLEARLLRILLVESLKNCRSFRIHGGGLKASQKCNCNYAR